MKSPPKIKKPKKFLVFIDTNIFLDFYRARNDAGLSLLAKIDLLQECIITSCQVEMEFKKNRQIVMIESINLLKNPEINLQSPAFLAEAKTVAMARKRIDDIRKGVSKLKARLGTMLEQPKARDPIYQTTHRLFGNSSPLNLARNTKDFAMIRRKALRRYLEGQPPRKEKDTSIGDAINWEWILECIRRTNLDVIVVSRDADYGVIHDKSGHLNNWLQEDVREINQQRKVILVDRLSAAFKSIAIPVTQKELDSESAIVRASRSPRIKGALREIRALPFERQRSELEDLISDQAHDLVNGDRIGELIAGTNAFGWGLDTLGVLSWEFKEGYCVAGIEFSISGDQDDDKPWHGSQIDGSCFATIDSEGNVTFSGIKAQLDTGDEEDESSDSSPEDDEDSSLGASSSEPEPA